MLKNAFFTLIAFLVFSEGSTTQFKHGGSHYFPHRDRNGEFSGMLHNHPNQRYSDYSEYPDFAPHSKEEEKTIPVSEMQILNEESAAAAASASQVSETRADLSNKDDGFVCVSDWPMPQNNLGQVSAVSIDTSGNIVVFHRGSRTWNSNSFGPNDRFNEVDKGPIKENTVLVFNVTTGEVIHEWGSGLFYLPHGLTVDHENNIWVTDVAMHQVFKFPSNGGKEPLLVLGTRFIPGKTDNHFCKPTDVAVMSNGQFFVSDGYCNSRILKYSKDGKKILEWGRESNPGIAISRTEPYFFAIPHALTLAEDKDMLCVADRENGRVQCFNCQTGMFMMQVRSDLMGSRIFSVSYSPAKGGSLYVVNGPEFANTRVAVSGFVINLVTHKPVEQFMPKGKPFTNPHDIAVTASGKEVYVVELGPYNVWKFIKGGGDSHSSPVNKSSVVVTEGLPNSTLSMENKINSADVEETKLFEFSNKDQASSVNKTQSSGATAIGVIIGAAAVIGVVMLIALVRMRKRGRSKKIRDTDRSYEYQRLVVE